MLSIHYPARGRKLSQTRSCYILFSTETFNPLPRKGTETSRHKHGGPNAREILFQSITPQGDGNPTSIFRYALHQRLSIHYPARGRKLIFLDERVGVDAASFQSITPQGDGNITNIENKSAAKKVQIPLPRKGTETLIAVIQRHSVI